MGVLVLLVLQVLLGIHLSLCSEENSTATQFMATSSLIEPSITPDCPMLSPTMTVTEMEDDNTFLSIPQSYLPIIVIVLFFATVILCFTSLILTMGLFILCCRMHNQYSPPNITAPMMKSNDELWKPIPKPLTDALAEDEDGKYLEVNEVTMKTFRKNHGIITPSHTPLISKGNNQSNDNEIILPLHARPYPIPTVPDSQEGLPSTFTGQSTRYSRQHSLAEASQSFPIDIGSPAEKPSLPRSTSDGSMYMKMESCSVVLQSKPYLPEAESLESVSYIDYVLPPNNNKNAKEDEYENASALRLANLKKNNSVQPSTPNEPPPANDINFKRPPEPKPKPSKPRKMNSAGFINPVLLPAANEELHYPSPRSAGLTSDGYKQIEATTLETSVYAIPIRGNSLPGHADKQRPKPPY